MVIKDVYKLVFSYFILFCFSFKGTFFKIVSQIGFHWDVGIVDSESLVKPSITFSTKFL